MMDDLVKRSMPLPANFGENLMRGIADTRATMQISDGGKDLLRLLKTGRWVFGQKNELVESGTEWAVNVASLARGWVCWDDGEILGQAMASVQVDRLPQPPHIDGVPFVEQFSMELTCITDSDNGGRVVLYKNNSIGFKRAFELLLSEIQMRWANDAVNGKRFFWPVVELSKESYDHKKYGEIHNPILTITAWCDADGEFSPDSEDLTASAPPKAVAPPPPPPQPAPARRRGRPPAAAAAAQEATMQAAQAAQEEALKAAKASRTPQDELTRRYEEPLTQAAPQSTQQAHVGQRRRPVSR